ncbi:MAG TPA: response regulator [Opitutaceae bacterium]|jgi:CheY-like chemotaxis protein|nr:MAG: Chemotaxis protein CheY [Verrucomicrobia bacterium ADurb.Bin122]HOD47675.1 response regulator [Opitutaceae bacterium]HOF08927.1 response regulator [Opitutaceae bacterium]HOR24286.1 response regulator [Opitutaceae bacterium]HOY55669.1 response regulator [Opitutaceae bacterium]
MKTILVVDDFASVRLYHTTFLKQKGYDCVAVSDGAEALRVLQQRPIDLVLLDMVMPTMDGIEFLARVRSMPGFASLPILAITSEAQKAETLESQARYGFHVLLKPVLPAALLEQVQRLLPLE